MSDTALIVLGLLDVVALVAVFRISRASAKRRAEGRPRPPRWARILTALLLLAVVVGTPTFVVCAVTSQGDRAERLREELRETGTAATGVVRDISETGTVVNHRPEMDVWVSVQPTEGKPFDARATWVFSVQDAQSYRVGTKVRVLFDPEDHARVAVVGVAPPDPSK